MSGPLGTTSIRNQRRPRSSSHTPTYRRTVGYWWESGARRMRACFAPCPTLVEVTPLKAHYHNGFFGAPINCLRICTKHDTEILICCGGYHIPIGTMVSRRTSRATIRGASWRRTLPCGHPARHQTLAYELHPGQRHKFKRRP